MDSQLFKEAIADAKAVRQTALANAKVALEEAFSENYSKLFDQRLREDAATESVPPSTEEEGLPMNPEENASIDEIDELIKELEGEVADKPPTDPSLPPAGSPVPGAESPGAEVPPMGGDVAPIPPLVAPSVPGAGCIPPQSMGGVPPATPMGAPPIGGEMGAGAPPPPPSDAPQASTEEDENINLDELLESLKQEIDKEEDEGCNEEEDESKKLDEDRKLASSGIGGNKAGGASNKQPAAGAKSSSKIESGGLKQHGVPSPDGTKIGPEDATKAKRPNEGKNATSTNLSTPSKGGTSGPLLKAARPNQGEHATDTDLSTPGGMLKENQYLKKQLDEATLTIKYVKGQLNEINLLNAKLLYTNKLFKEYNMNNEHKMRIVEMFDLSKNVREVKLTYANLAESLNFGGVDQRKRVTTTNSSIQSITEGLASKPVGSTKPGKEIISESKSAMVSKFQKLAGIKSK